MVAQRSLGAIRDSGGQMHILKWNTQPEGLWSDVVAYLILSEQSLPTRSPHKNGKAVRLLKNEIS